jgi:hypothetical protein
MRPRFAAAAFAVALGLGGAAAGWGHDLGTVQVYGTFLKNGTYRLDVVVDEEHLRASQEGGPPHATRYGRIAGLGEATARRMGRFLSDLAGASTLAFDGNEASPELEIAPPDPEGPAQRPGRAVLRLSGETPGGVHTFTWNNALRLGRYPVVLRNEGVEASLWQWLEDGHASPPFALARDVVPPPAPPVALVAARYLRRGFAGVLPRGSEAILFVLGLALLCIRVRPMLAQAAAFAAAFGSGLMLAAAHSLPSLPPLLLLSPLSTPAAALIALTLVGLALDNLWSVWSARRSGGAGAARSSGGGRGGGLLGMPLRAGVVVLGGLMQGVAAGRLLSQAGLPRGRAGVALGGYGLGAAAAMAAVLGVAFLLFGASFRLRPWYPRRVIVPGSALLAAVGLFWSVQSLM